VVLLDAQALRIVHVPHEGGLQGVQLKAERQQGPVLELEFAEERHAITHVRDVLQGIHVNVHLLDVLLLLLGLLRLGLRVEPGVLEGPLLGLPLLAGLLELCRPRPEPLARLKVLNPGVDLLLQDPLSQVRLAGLRALPLVADLVEALAFLRGAKLGEDGVQGLGRDVARSGLPEPKLSLILSEVDLGQWLLGHLGLLAQEVALCRLQPRVRQLTPLRKLLVALGNRSPPLPLKPPQPEVYVHLRPLLLQDLLLDVLLVLLRRLAHDYLGDCLEARIPEAPEVGLAVGRREVLLHLHDNVVPRHHASDRVEAAAGAEVVHVLEAKVELGLVI